MQYLFIPGRLPQLSEAELKSVLETFITAETTVNAKSDNHFLVRTDADQDDIVDVFQRLGGFIKLGIEIEDQESFLDLYTDNSNITFGISYYPYQGKKYSNIPSEFSHKIKSFYKAKGISSRYVKPDNNILSTGQILQREILTKGFEISLIEDRDGKVSAYNTLQIQDIEDFANRDYNRPGYDKEMGMLPPKLARIMVNLSCTRENGAIWDPFCGSGTILMEALMNGYNVIGSDISEQAVADTKRNILWLANTYDMGDQKYTAFVHDIRKFNSRERSDLRKTDFNAVVFEPYMGPPQKKILRPSKAETLLDEVSSLLEAAFIFFENVKKSNLIVVCVVPSYRTTEGWASLRYNSFLSKRWKIKGPKDKTKHLHWSRSNSIIRRNILIAELKR
jgi:tRNA G10  N-methylase Trm11